MIERIIAFWVIAGILSCFILSEPGMTRNMELVDIMMLIIIYTGFVILGPIGLTLILIAKLLVN